MVLHGSNKVPTVMHTKFALSVMVGSEPQGTCHVPCFFPQGLGINTTAYIKVLDAMAKALITCVPAGYCSLLYGPYNLEVG